MWHEIWVEVLATEHPLPRHDKGATMWVSSRNIELPRPRAGLFVRWLDFTRISYGVCHRRESCASRPTVGDIRCHTWRSAIRTLPLSPCPELPSGNLDLTGTFTVLRHAERQVPGTGCL